MHTAIEKLENFTPEERELAERLVRPATSEPDFGFDTKQFLGYLAQMNEARGTSQVLTHARLAKAGLLTAEATAPLKLAV